MKMCWLSLSGKEEDEPKILHLQLLPGMPWKPYTAFPLLKVEDHFLPKEDGSGFSMAGSQGYATYQKLLKFGWKLVKSSESFEVSSVIKNLNIFGNLYK